MIEYHKIQTVFLRDPATNYKTLLEGQYALPPFEYLKDNEWVFTEKVDGTNVRVIYDGVRVRFGGKTDDAQTPTILSQRLADMFTPEKLHAAFLPDDSNIETMTLYGEGYGARIQKGGGNYIRNACDFILFDVKVGDIWLERPNVEDIAAKLGISIVPIVGRGTLADAVEMVRGGFRSKVAAVEGTMAEGLVMRPAVEMRDRRGYRVITKLKHKDFVPAKTRPRG